MNLEQEVKNKLRKKKFRKRAIEKILYRLLIELKIEDVDLIDKLTYSLVDVISTLLEGQRYTNDEIATMYEVEKAINEDLIIVKDINVSLIHSDNLLKKDLKIKVGYVPKGVRISNDNLHRLIDLVAKRIQTEQECLNSIYYVISKLLNIQDVAIYLETCQSEYYFTNGCFRNSQALWQAFIK